MTAPDKYDEAIAYLTEHPDEIASAWGDGGPKQAVPLQGGGVLFDYVAPGCGCLTQIRMGADGPTPELAKAIRLDVRIPLCQYDITVDDLPVFAEWQRKIDAMDLGASS